MKLVLIESAASFFCPLPHCRQVVPGELKGRRGKRNSRFRQQCSGVIGLLIVMSFCSSVIAVIWLVKGEKSMTGSIIVNNLAGWMMITLLLVIGVKRPYFPAGSMHFSLWVLVAIFATLSQRH